MSTEQEKAQERLALREELIRRHGKERAEEIMRGKRAPFITGTVINPGEPGWVSGDE
jgi:hypothetical protein